MTEITYNYSDAAEVLLLSTLGFYNTEIPFPLQEHLRTLLNQAYRQLERAGIQLKIGDLYDDQLQVMYAAWLYRNAGLGAEKPPMLAQEIRDRQVENALAAQEESP